MRMIHAMLCMTAMSTASVCSMSAEGNESEGAGGDANNVPQEAAPLTGSESNLDEAAAVESIDPEGEVEGDDDQDDSNNDDGAGTDDGDDSE